MRTHQKTPESKQVLQTRELFALVMSHFAGPHPPPTSMLSSQSEVGKVSITPVGHLRLTVMLAGRQSQPFYLTKIQSLSSPTLFQWRSHRGGWSSLEFRLQWRWSLLCLADFIVKQLSSCLYPKEIGWNSQWIFSSRQAALWFAEWYSQSLLQLPIGLSPWHFHLTYQIPILYFQINLFLLLLQSISWFYPKFGRVYF